MDRNVKFHVFPQIRSVSSVTTKGQITKKS